MSTAKLMRAAELVVEGRAAEGAAMARALHDEAVALGMGTGDEATATTEQLAASLLDVLACAGQHEPSALSRALAFIEEARRARRPAWMAAGRAVAALNMVQSGVSADVLTMLALAELDLEDEVNGGEKLDPPGGPTGPGAAANNLGVVYHGIGLMDRAERHLLAAARASRDEYGPAYRGQVLVDLVNLLGFRLAFALEKETDADASGAREQAGQGLALMDEIGVVASGIDWPVLVDAARVLELGCLSVADPSAVPAGARHDVRAILHTSPDGSLLHDPMSYCVLARLCRQAGDTAGAVRAAELARDSDHGAGGPEVTWAWREAALAVEANDAPALLYARELRRAVCRHRSDLAEALEHRIEMLRMERRHQEVREARDRLERTLNEAREQEAALHHAAEHDPLTGLLNRTALQARVAAGLRAVGEESDRIALAFIDLDGFKQVNDRHGHRAGDRLLAAVASALRGGVRDTDTLARYGGDEFVCVRGMVGDPADLVPWAHRLREAVERASAAVDPDLQVSASIGICVIENATGLSAGDVLARADAAMYAAKRRGPGNVELVFES